MPEDKGRIFVASSGLLDIDLLSYESRGHEVRGSERGKSREAIARIYDVNATYFLLRTLANQQAVEELQKHTVTARECFDSPEDYDKMYGASSGPREPRQLRFTPEVMDVYLNALGKMAETDIGREKYANYPLVGTKGVHSLDRAAASVSWPTIHVLKGREASQEFEHLVGELNGDTAYQHIKKRELPQNWRMGEVNFLREHKIAPLVIENRVWQVDGKTLREAIDFLVSFGVYREWNGPVMDAD